MTAKENILELETRKKIYDFIFQNPGLHMRELSRDLEIPKTTLSYHLNFFIKNQMVSEKKDNGYKRYFISKTKGTADKKLFSLLREPIPRNIILLLVLYPPISKKEIINLLKEYLKINKHPTTIDFHIKKLVKMNIVNCVIINNEKKYEISNKEDYYEFLLANEKFFNKKTNISFFIFHINDMPRYIFDNIIKGTYEIFPHPYFI
jgi:predicted transcriptional regulator